jgi:glycosyltransferase involved in cell wall biosynthesis
MNNCTKVTIGITTYNLESYIAQALDSILMQNTSFKYEILITDDASTDKTVYILKEYKAKYPEKINIILSNKNKGSLSNSNILFSNIKTQYFSFLDGDDYWIDEYRLQKQVDFLDKHNEYSMCGGNIYYVKDNVYSGYRIDKKYLGKSYTYDDYLNDRCPFVHTSSILMRNIVFKYGIPQYFKDAENTIFDCAFRGESLRFLLHLQKGKIYLFDNFFSCYRIHKNGIWQSKTELHKNIEHALTFIKYSQLFEDNKNFFHKKFYYCYIRIFQQLFMENRIYREYNMLDVEHNSFITLLEIINNNKNYFHEIFCLYQKNIKFHKKILLALFDFFLRIIKKYKILFFVLYMMR